MENRQWAGMLKKTKIVLITGITGQDGSYLAEFLLKKGYQVHGMVRRVAFEDGEHRFSRINHLIKNNSIKLHGGSLESYPSICNVLTEVKPDEIYHLAAQSFVSYSFEDEHSTMHTNVSGIHYILAAASQIVPKAKFYFAASSEMFGDVLEVPQTELTAFNPRSPYGVSKVTGYHLARYHRNHPDINMFAVCGILFNHECITSETPILIEKNGFIDIARIEEVVPHRTNPRHDIKYSTIIKSGLRVWDGTSWTKIKTATATWNKTGMATDKKVKRVICRGGYYEATYDHLSFLNSGRTVKTGNLKSGDNLKLFSLPPLNPKISITREEAEFLGMMVADGYIHGDGSGRFINNDKKMRLRLADLWQKIAGGQSQETTHPSGFNAKKNVYSLELSGNTNYLRFIWSQIYDQKLFKKVPQRILNSGSDIIKVFLAGYNTCDGLKGGHQKTEFKSFTTNSPPLALGLWYLVNNALGLRITIHPEFRKNWLYFHLNINTDKKTGKGKHLQKEISEVKNIKNYKYTGWLFDLETESGTFSAGVGLNWIHNSPRRGMEFVTRKITHTAALIKHGLANKLYLGNPKAKRDWGYAGDFVEAMWLMMQQPKPDDFVIATGETHTVREFAEEAFKVAGLNPKKYIVWNNPADIRPSEVNLLIGNPAKARKVLGWKPKVKFKELVKMMVEADMELVGKNLEIRK